MSEYVTVQLPETPKGKSTPSSQLLQHYAGSTILVSGGLGFIGSALIRALSPVTCQIIQLVRPGTSVDSGSGSKSQMAGPEIVCQNIVNIEGDVQDRETWKKSLGNVDYVFHFAAQTSASVAEQDPLADLNANVVPVIQMMEACRHSGLRPTVLFAGTTTQVGLPTQLPVDENFPDQPIIVYDIHKLAAEKYLQYYSNHLGIPTVTLRLSNVYGPGTNVSSSDRGVLNMMIKRAIEGQPLTVYGQGERVRDYVFIDDVVRAFLMAGAASELTMGKYYVIGSGTGTRIVDAMKMVADRVELRLGRRPEVTNVPAPATLLPIEERDFIADTGRFREATGWRAQVALAGGVDLTVEHFLELKEVA